MAKRTGTQSGPKNAPLALTANDLLTGGIVWWTGTRWSRHYGEAVQAETDEARAALAGFATMDAAHDNVVGATLVTIGADGLPTGLREGRRFAGPSIALPGDRPVAEAA